MSIAPRSVLLLAGIVAGLSLTGCGGSGGGVSAPKPGTNSHAWSSAQETYKQGNFVKSMDYLSRLTAKDNEYRERARMMLILVAGGVAEGYGASAAGYETGSKMSKNMGLEYRKHMNEARNMANQASMEFVTAVHDYMATKPSGKPDFAFGFPSGTLNDPLQFSKINQGLNLGDADDEALLQAMAQRGVVQFASSIGGSPKDPAKAAAQFPSPDRDRFLAAVAESLYKRADLYCNRKLDVPQRGNALCKQALEAASMMPDSKEKKALENKIKEEIKRYKVQS